MQCSTDPQEDKKKTPLQRAGSILLDSMGERLCVLDFLIQQIGDHLFQGLGISGLEPL